MSAPTQRVERASGDATGLLTAAGLARSLLRRAARCEDLR